jgi:hypothetical protein
MCKRFLAFFLLILIGFISFSKAADSSFTVGSLSFTAPSEWTKVNPTSPMRKAEFSITKDSKTARIVFFYFGKDQGGTNQANIDRWQAQFENDRRNIQYQIIKDKNHPITYFYIEGTFLDGMPGQPAVSKPNYALLGAIVEHSQGNVYVKMTGDQSLVKEITPAFKKMIESSPK